MKRILVLLPRLSGFEGQIVNELQIINALIKCARVYLVGFREIRDKGWSSIQVKDNCTYFTLPMAKGLIAPSSIFISIFISFFMRIFLLDRLIDVVYCRESPSAVGFMLFKRVAARTIVKIVALPEDETRNIFLKRILSATYRITDRLSIKRAGRIAVPSIQFSKLLFLRRQIKPKRAPLIISPGIDLSLIRRIILNIKRKKSRFKTFRIGYVGTISWWQGLDLLIQALDQVQKNVSDIKLVLIGDGPERAMIEQMCRYYKIRYEITGYLSHEECLKNFNALALLTVPSKKITTTDYNIPIKIIESWAFGIPVLATRRAILAEKYKDGRDIVFCEPTPESIANKILFIIKNKQIYRRLSKRGRILASDFLYEKIVDNILHFNPEDG